MKKKSFFYKFDKNRDRFKSSNHSFFAEEENKTFSKLTALLDKKDEIEDLVNKTDSEVENYYKKRINYKKIILDSKPYLDKYRDYILGVNEYIFTLKFDKILSYNDIEKLQELLGVNVIRISGYDTTIEIFSKNKQEILSSILNLVENEVLIINDIIKNNNDYKENSRFILSLEDIGIDTTNRKELDEMVLGDNMILSFSKKYFSEEKNELEILKKIYKEYKKSDSKVDIITNEDNIYNINIVFSNLAEGFIEDVKILDGLVNIEIIDIEEETDFENIDYNISLPVITESTNLDISKVCIVDSKINNNEYFLGNLNYGTIEDNYQSAHGTCVGLLAMYGKLNINQTSLPLPDCSIYNISLINPFKDIKRMIDEAYGNGCKIVNISMGIRGYINDNAGISSIAYQIDTNLTNKDILVVLSGGNITPSKSNYLEISEENANINIPKDSISSIVVGAKNDDENMELYSRKNNIDSYTDIGGFKGYQLRLKDKKKPDFIDYGENIVFNGSTWNKGFGTSFSAPLLSNKSAKLFNIYNDISTNTVKGLLINYSSIEDFSDSGYKKGIQERHIGRGNIDIGGLLDDNDKNTLNIVIEDYISNNEKKEYPINLPELENNSVVGFSRSISYNPPVDQNYHLKYCKFCVSSKMWSHYYESKKQEFFDTTDDKDKAYNKFSTWKKEKISEQYTRPLNWVNYFGNNNFWSSNSYRFNLLNKELYDELKDGAVIEIEGHTRNNFSFTQKFSLVVTIDISIISDKEKFIDDFYKINSGILIHGEDIENINNNISVKEQEFINEISDEVIVDVESF